MRNKNNYLFYIIILVLNQNRLEYNLLFPVSLPGFDLHQEFYNLELDFFKQKGTAVGIKMTLTAPGCGMGPVIAQDVETKILNLGFVEDVLVEVVWEPLWNQNMMSEEAQTMLGMELNRPMIDGTRAPQQEVWE